MDTNRITHTKELIRQTIRKVGYDLVAETTTLETDITPDATLFVDITATGQGIFTEIEITGIDLLKDTYRRSCSLPNIAEHIACELDKIAKKWNRDNK